MEDSKYPFDEEFQNAVVCLALRDTNFMRRCSHLLFPKHFGDVGNACAIQLALKFFKRYHCTIDYAALKVTLQEAINSKAVSEADRPFLFEAIKRAYSSNIPASAPFEDKVAEFAREQAVIEAIEFSVEKLGNKEYDSIRDKMQKALDVGISDEGEAYDYYAEIQSRTDERKAKIAGMRPPRGISTGVDQLDDLLYHRGWGRKELAVLMGGAKSGKSGNLINFASNASQRGYNVLYTTLEVSARILSERLDAYITGTPVRDLEDNVIEVGAKVAIRKEHAGRLIIHEFPSGSMTPRMLDNLIEKYRNRGVVFDLVIVDYADIMAPDHRVENSIENSKEIYVGLRALAFKYDCAMLTATQTNREGYKAVVAKAEHVAEDFNKIRTADLVISINATEEERRNGEARLYFAASRNQESGFTVKVKQDLKKMSFIESVIGVE